MDFNYIFASNGLVNMADWRMYSQNAGYNIQMSRPAKVSDWRKYVKSKSRPLLNRPPRSLVDYRPDPRNSPAELPKSTWVLHSGDTHIVNDRRLLVAARKCDEYLYDLSGRRMEAKFVGDVHLKLDNNLMIDLQRVRFSKEAKYNLLSEGALRVDMGFAIEFGQLKTHLRFKDKSGVETRFEAANTVAGKFVVLTKEPAIETVIEYAANHPTSKQFESVSIFTQSSGVGQSFRRLEVD